MGLVVLWVKRGDGFGCFVGQDIIQSRSFQPEKIPGTKIPRNVPPPHFWDTHNQFPMYAVGFVTALGM